MVISLSTNIDLQNYEQRIDDIVKYMNPLGIEIFSLPQNYANNYQFQLELHDKQKSHKFSLLSKILAKDIGKKFKKYGIRKIQYHYPWEKTLYDMNGLDIELTIQFCDIILEESKADQLTINHHNTLKYPILSKVKSLNVEYRKNLLNMLEIQSTLVQQIKKQFKSPFLLIVENNPAVSNDVDNKTKERILDNIDLVVEDYENRKGIEGVTLDYSHAWTVVKYFEGDKKYENLEWCKKQYNGIPESAKSLENFVKKAASKIKWVHLSDEPNPYAHFGVHIGDGSIDFNECIKLLNKYLKEDIVATIEVKDGHTNEGFKRIIEHDFPYLKNLLKLKNKI